MSEYGDPTNETDFEYMIKYSPLHNVRVPGGSHQYPAAFLTTGVPLQLRSPASCSAAALLASPASIAMPGTAQGSFVATLKEGDECDRALGPACMRLLACCAQHGGSWVVDARPVTCGAETVTNARLQRTMTTAWCRCTATSSSPRCSTCWRATRARRSATPCCCTSRAGRATAAVRLPCAECVHCRRHYPSALL